MTTPQQHNIAAALLDRAVPIDDLHPHPLNARRRDALVELEPKYADVICRRWQEHTDDKPVLEATGEPADFTRIED